MLEKESFDVRGREMNLLKTLNYDKEAFLHLASFRVLIVLSIFMSAMFFANILFGLFGGYIKAAIVLAWLLITPQLYEVMKAFSLITSGGFAFGKMNKSFLDLMREKTNKLSYKVLVALPAIGIIIWIAVLAAFIAV